MKGFALGLALKQRRKAIVGNRLFNKETTSAVFLQLQSARVNFRLITD